MKSTPTILTHIANLGLIKEYNYFLKIKSIHSNSVIYKPKKLHEKLNCSKTKINRLLAIIIEQGWGYYSKGHLVLNSAETIHNNYHHKKSKYYIEIKNREDIHLELLKQKLRQQAFIKDKISDLKSNSGKAKKAIKFLQGEKKFITNEQLNGKQGTGLQTLSSVFGYSEGHTGYLLRQMDSSGLITIKRRKPVLKSFVPNFPIKYIPKGYYLKNNCFLYQFQTNIIIPEL